MAGSNVVLDKGYISTGTLATLYLPVKFGTVDGVVVAPTAVTDVIVGVAQEICLAADAGKRVVSVRKLGLSLMVAKGAITRGDRVKLDATFTGIVTAGVAADVVVGLAEESAVAGDQIHVMLAPGGLKV